MEELSVEEFLRLPEVHVARRKVDYDKVLESIVGKPVSVKTVGELMLKNSDGKTKVYYSEIMRFLLSLEKKGYSVTFRYITETKDNPNLEKGKYVLVRKVEQTRRAKKENR